MPYALPENVRAWQARMREFVDRELIPLEVETELNDGHIAPEVRAKHFAATKAMGLFMPSIPKEDGGAGLTMLEVAVIQEQIGRATNGLGFCYHDLSPFLVRTATPYHREHYVRDLLTGARNECYAITEEGAGSDVDAIQATAKRQGNGFRLDGLKWHVTGADSADIVIFQAKLEDGSHGLFYLDRDHEGVEVVRTPKYMHTMPGHHLIMRFTDVRVPAANQIDPEGGGLQWTYEWFRQERLKIAARCCGAASRLIDEITAFARSRVQFGRPIWDNQGVQFPIADSLTELWAGRLMVYRLAEAWDRGEDVKVQHALCSMAKLYCSEMANRVADRSVQIFGGRGYMRENVAERFYREVRVDRIWEGTSEIQRLIVAASLAKRGQDALIG
jgi:alkylation response protein AidB-like acyl-CoA dehydrogenase